MDPLHVARSWALWWLALFGLWVVMEGTNEAMELAAGAGAAALAASLLELVRRQGLLRLAPDIAAVASAARLPTRILREFWILSVSLALELAGIRRIRSAWVAVPFEAGGDDPLSAGNRALRPLIDNVTPLTIVADVDRDRDVALKHDLVPSRASKTVP
jgi:multisubunit Na+/H+ antiporter MnhE subunit